MRAVETVGDFAPAIDDEGLPPGSGFAVAIGSHNALQSSVWDIHSSKNSADLYISPRATSKFLKVSLHESGDYQHSIHSNIAMNFVTRNQDRYLYKWNNSTSVGGGWKRGYYIMVPRTELRFDSEKIEGVRYAPDPGRGFWATIEVILAEPGTSAMLRWNAGFLLGSLKLTDGGGASVVAMRHRPDPSAARAIREFRDRLLNQAASDAESLRPLSNMSNPVAFLYGNQSDGTEGAIEVSLAQQPAEVRVICTAMQESSSGSLPSLRWLRLNG